MLLPAGLCARGPQEPPRRPAGGHAGRVAPRLLFCPFLIYCTGCVSAASPLCGQRVLVFNQLRFTALCFFPLWLPQDTQRVETPCFFSDEEIANKRGCVHTSGSTRARPFPRSIATHGIRGRSDPILFPWRFWGGGTRTGHWAR